MLRQSVLDVYCIVFFCTYEEYKPFIRFIFS